MFLLISSYIADLIFGDPEWLPHPVRWMGKLINLLDKGLNKKGESWIKRIKGILTSFLVIGISAYSAYLLLELSRRLNPFLYHLAWVYIGYTTISVKDLQVKAKAIYKELEKGDIFKARKELFRIVGRDTKDMSEDEIKRATIESIAENTNDGIVAPLFYLILGGPVLAVAYKAINTLDSMVGYKNEKYLYFGWFPARLDDVANYVPARISGFLISLSSFILGKPRSCHAGTEGRGKGFRNSFETMLKDGRKHPSPNSGISEAAMAGALGIRLGGGAFYQGRFVERQHIGMDIRKVDIFLIDESLRISLLTSFLMLIIGVLLKWLT
ncbi:MAG: adenosylcobinamide-phosphate synthase CbiB [Nitrospirota bacterium]